MSLTFSSQTFSHEALQNLVKRIAIQNQCAIIRARQTGWNPFYFVAKHLALVYLRIIRWGWDVGPEQPISSLTLRSIFFSQNQCKQIFQVIDPRVQKKIQLIDVNIDSQSFHRLIQRLISHPIKYLNLSQTDLSHIPLQPLVTHLKNNTFQVKCLELNHTQLTPETIAQLIDALKTNSFVTQISLLGASLTPEQMQTLENIQQRNQWIQTKLKQNPHKILNLQNECLTDLQFEGISLLMEQGKYRKIETAQGQISDVMAQNWIKVLQTNAKIRRINFNQEKLQEITKQKLHQQLAVNRAIRKLFGKSTFLSRGTFLMGIIFANFCSAFVQAANLTNPLIFGLSLWGIGAFVIAVVFKISSNYIFLQNLKQAKTVNYWENPSNAKAYKIGRTCANNYLPWLKLQSWSTPAYLGYIHKKNHIKSVLPKTIKPKI